MEKIAVISLKGGVGKTTVSINLSAALARRGKRVLLIDLDSQNDLTQNLGVEPALIKGVEYLITGDFLVENTIHKYNENLHFIPSGKGLKDIEISLSKKTKGIEDINKLLQRSLDELTDLRSSYDYVIVDCPNHPGILNINAMVYVDQVYIPIPCKHLGIRGAKRTAFFVHKNKTFYNKDLHVSAIIPVMFDVRNKLSAEVYEQIHNSFEKQAFNTKIHANVALAEAPAYGKTIYDYKPKSRGAADFEDLAKEVIERSRLLKEKAEREPLQPQNI